MSPNEPPTTCTPQTRTTDLPKLEVLPSPHLDIPASWVVALQNFQTSTAQYMPPSQPPPCHCPAPTSHTSFFGPSFNKPPRVRPSNPGPTPQFPPSQQVPPTNTGFATFISAITMLYLIRSTNRLSRFQSQFSQANPGRPSLPWSASSFPPLPPHAKVMSFFFQLQIKHKYTKVHVQRSNSAKAKCMSSRSACAKRMCKREVHVQVNVQKGSACATAKVKCKAKCVCK